MNQECNCTSMHLQIIGDSGAEVGSITVDLDGWKVTETKGGPLLASLWERLITRRGRKTQLIERIVENTDVQAGAEDEEGNDVSVVGGATAMDLVLTP